MWIAFEVFWNQIEVKKGTLSLPTLESFTFVSLGIPYFSCQMIHKELVFHIWWCVGLLSFTKHTKDVLIEGKIRICEYLTGSWLLCKFLTRRMKSLSIGGEMIFLHFILSVNHINGTNWLLVSLYMSNFYFNYIPKLESNCRLPILGGAWAFHDII